MNTDLADACPACHPGLPDAALPLEAPQQVAGGVIATYRCSTCHVSWATFWDSEGWPIDRMVERVTEEEAAENRATLERILRNLRAA